MSKLATKIKAEFEELLPPAIFFFLALHLVAIVRVLMLEGTGVPLGTSASITVAALILAKAVLIADLLPFINRYPDKPLIYNVAWKTAIYVLIAMLLHYLENLVEFWRKAGGVVAGNEMLLKEIVWPHFWAIQILLVVLILMYVTMREVIREIGKDKVRQMFFGPPQKASGSQD
jgi:chromate transport protein ChrA